jgi:hypothetical protein
VTQPDDETPETPARDDEEAAPGKAKKERVLHTRVPAILEDELKRLATALRMPVSNVVRAILEDAVEAVEVVGERAEGELKGIAHRISEQRESLRRAVQGDAPRAKATTSKTKPKPVSEPDPLDGVIGFQELRLANAASCAVCDVTLPRGSTAHRTVRDDDRTKVLLCTACMPGPDEG